MIWIRADANKDIGSGHVMRCLSIAAALQKMGEQVCFIVADEGAATLLQDRGQEYKILHTVYKDMESELERFCGMLCEQKPDLLLVDSYFTTEKYLRKVREVVRVAVMDDVPRFAYPVDGIVNYNIYGADLKYEEVMRKADERNGEGCTCAGDLPEGRTRRGTQHCLCLGTAYAPLREQFQGIAYTVRQVVGDVLITTGGSDKYNLAGKILEAVLAKKETSGLGYHVVSGAFNPHLPYLQELAEKHTNIKLYQNVRDMASLMQQADIAITAGGSTMYELCAVGVPILCFSFVDNQELIVETFAGKGLVAYGGNYLKEKEAFAGNVTEALAALAGSFEARQSYSSRERQLVDGKGAHRLAEALCEWAARKERHGR